MAKKNKDFIDEAIDRTFSRSSIDGPFHDAEKEIQHLDETIELSINRIYLSAEDMAPEDVSKIISLLKDSLTLLTNKACHLIDNYRNW